MRVHFLRAITLCSLSCTLFASTPHDPAEHSTGAEFAAPVRLKAGDAYVGAKRLYPSPMLQDVNGDGRLDMVIGDLFGRLTYASRDGQQERVGFAAKQTLKDRDDEDLDFNNW